MRDRGARDKRRAARQEGGGSSSSSSKFQRPALASGSGGVPHGAMRCILVASPGSARPASRPPWPLSSECLVITRLRIAAHCDQPFACRDARRRRWKRSRPAKASHPRRRIPPLPPSVEGQASCQQDGTMDSYILHPLERGTGALFQLDNSGYTKGGPPLKLPQAIREV